MQQKISRLRSRSAERISKRLLKNGQSSRSTSVGDDDENENFDAEEPENEEQIVVQNYRMTKSFSGLPSISGNNSEIYNGPFIGRARALVDYIPSPYDRDALRFSVSIYPGSMKVL